MNGTTIQQIWTYVGLANLYLSFNIASHMHGSEFFLPFIRLDSVNDYAAAVYGIFITVPIGILVFILTREFCKISNFSHWAKRIPIAFGFPIEFGSKLGKAYQAFFLVIFLVLPAFANIDFLNKFFHGTIYDRETQTVISVSLEHLWPDRDLLDSHGKKGYRYGEANDASKKPGIDIFPVIIPWVIVLIELIYFAYFLFTILSIVSTKDAADSAL
jgi:hypothetical protein